MLVVVDDSIPMIKSDGRFKDMMGFKEPLKYEQTWLSVCVKDLVSFVRLTQPYKIECLKGHFCVFGHMAYHYWSFSSSSRNLI